MKRIILASFGLLVLTACDYGGQPSGGSNKAYGSSSY